MESTRPSRKLRRCYHRVISGLEKGGALRLITLTSSPDAPDDIQRSFRKLVMRLRRRGLLQDYIRVIEFTEAGAPHIHMCFRGDFIEQKLLSHLWEQIHASPVVDIRRVKHGKNHKRNVAAYLAKYMSKDLVRKYSWSWGWVYKGFVKTWVKAYRIVLNRGELAAVKDPWRIFLRIWRRHLRDQTPPSSLFFELAIAFAPLQGSAAAS